MDSDQPETPLIQRQIKLELKSDGLVYCKMCIPIVITVYFEFKQLFHCETYAIMCTIFFYFKAGTDEPAGSPKFLGRRLQKNSKFTVSKFLYLYRLFFFQLFF